MATLKDFDQWLNQLRRAGSAHLCIEEMEAHGMPDPQRNVRIYTQTNKYKISAHVGRGGGYLGCIASCRTPRAGESWTRGNDLADGKLSSATWHRILADIVCNEMVTLDVQRSPALPDNAESPEPDDRELKTQEDLR